MIPVTQVGRVRVAEERRVHEALRQLQHSRQWTCAELRLFRGTQAIGVGAWFAYRDEYHRVEELDPRTMHWISHRNARFVPLTNGYWYRQLKAGQVDRTAHVVIHYANYPRLPIFLDHVQRARSRGRYIHRSEATQGKLALLKSPPKTTQGRPALPKPIPKTTPRPDPTVQARLRVLQQRSRVDTPT